MLCVSNMNGITRKKKYYQVSLRDGEFCHNCEKLPSAGQLVVDHIDNNNDNNSLENLQLLCRACNYRKNPKRPVDMCVDNNTGAKDDSISINRSTEPRFRKFVYDVLDVQGKILMDDLMDSGAEFVGISIETAKRHLKKMISSYGKLERVSTFSLGWAIKYKEGAVRDDVSINPPQNSI